MLVCIRLSNTPASASTVVAPQIAATVAPDFNNSVAFSIIGMCLGSSQVSAPCYNKTVEGAEMISSVVISGITFIPPFVTIESFVAPNPQMCTVHNCRH